MLDDFTNHLNNADLALRTVRAYTDHLRLFATWFEQTNGQPLDKSNISQNDLREYKQYLLQHQASPSTINTKLAALRVFAAWCGKTVLVKSVDQQPLAPKWLDRRQQASLLREAEALAISQRGPVRKAQAERDCAVIVVLLNTGLRVSEFCDLQSVDVILNDRSGQLTVHGKRSKQRLVPLNSDARTALRKLHLPIKLNPRQVQRAVEEIARRAGIEASPHTLRHTFAHNLAERNVPADRIAALLGHDDLNTTRRYTIPGERELQQAVETLE